MIVCYSLLINELVLMVVLVAVIIALMIPVIMAMRMRLKEVPMKVRSLVMSRGFTDARSGVRMCKANPLEEKRWNQEQGDETMDHGTFLLRQTVYSKFNQNAASVNLAGWLAATSQCSG